MKRYSVFFFFLILLPMLSASCEVNSGKNGPEYLMTREDHSHGYAFPAGHYYAHAVTAFDDQAEPLATFRSLAAKGIIVKEAWYRPYLTGCSPPGSGRTTTAIHSNVFIVRLDEPDDGILNHDFRALESPKPIVCGYAVWHYALEQ